MRGRLRASRTPISNPDTQRWTHRWWAQNSCCQPAWKRKPPRNKEVFGKWMELFHVTHTSVCLTRVVVGAWNSYLWEGPSALFPHIQAAVLFSKGGSATQCLWLFSIQVLYISCLSMLNYEMQIQENLLATSFLYLFPFPWLCRCCDVVDTVNMLYR